MRSGSWSPRALKQPFHALLGGGREGGLRAILGYSEMVVHKHQGGSRSTTDGVEVLWSALGITMSDYDHYLRIPHFGPLATHPPTCRKGVKGLFWGPGRP